MAKRKQPSVSPKKISISAAILAAAFFVLVLLNEAMGTGLPLPSVSELQQTIGSTVDGLYQSGGLSEQPAPVEGDLRIHYIDVGQADCELIQTPEQNVLIDAGDQGMGDQIADYLKAQGVERIDILIATHPHADHIGSMAEIVQQFDIERIIFSAVPDNLVPTTKTYERLLDSIADKGLKITKAKPGNQYDLGGGALMTILAPQKQYSDDLNDNSVVCRVTFGNTAFLFDGDAGRDSESDILKKYDANDLKADVLKLGHHGSSTASSAKWLDAVRPDYAIASCGYDNKYGHPHKEVVQALQKRDITLYRTDETGTVVIATDGEQLSIGMER